MGIFFVRLGAEVIALHERDDRKMLMESDTELRITRLLHEWSPGFFHQAFSKHFKALDAYPDDPSVVLMRELFPFRYLSSRNKWLSQKDGGPKISQYACGESLGALVYRELGGNEICPHDVATLMLPRLYPGKVRYGCASGVGQSAISVEVVDSSPIWEPFCSVYGNRHPWVALRNLESLRVPPEKCERCGQGFPYEVIKSEYRLVVVVWGVGRTSYGGGYFAIKTSVEKTGEPYVSA